MMQESKIPTPHISAKAGDFAKTVLMPGDPLRAKFYAENFLANARLVTSVRNMLGYTGTYKGVPVSVMGSGMGMPSIGIYSYELYHFYDVDNIIRVGSAGSIQKDLKVGDLVLAQGACDTSAYVDKYRLPGHYAPVADFDLLHTAYQKARGMGISVRVGNVLSEDCFYSEGLTAEPFAKMGVLCLEMEAAALYMNAAFAGKRALGIMTIANEIFTGAEIDSTAREKNLEDMARVALETAVEFS